VFNGRTLQCSKYGLPRASVPARVLPSSIVKVLLVFQLHCETKGAFVISEEAIASSSGIVESLTKRKDLLE